MKSICRISGIPIWKSDLLLGLDLADEHPIFRAKKAIIFNKDMAFRFSETENVLEKRLIFLATLHATLLVTFEVPACPSLMTMESSFYKLMPLAQWVNFAEYKLARIVSFPQYVVRKDNADLSNIKSWLDALDDIRVKVYKRELEQDRNAELWQKEQEIRKEINDANFFGKAFTPRLAKWALDICDISIRNPDYAKWMKILCLPTNEAWVIPLEEYLELQEIFEIRLPNLEQNPQAISVMFQLKSLIAECKRGFTEVSIFSDDGSDKETSDFEIIDEDEETHERKSYKINQHLLGIPTGEPLPKEYPTKVAYLIAKAKWELSMRKKDSSAGKDSV